MVLNEAMVGRQKDRKSTRHQRRPLNIGGWFWRRAKRWQQNHPTSLFTASALVLAVLAVAAVGLWYGLAWRLAGKQPWDLPSAETTEFSVLRMVLFILAGAVGAIGVVVAYRRQRGAEQGRFLEQMAEGSRLLGDQNPTVQAAGIYALAGLADTAERDRRQQCVDVLCAYIRLPYAPAPEGSEPEALENVMRRRTLDTENGPVEEEHTLFRPHDRHTRETIIRVITQHLRVAAKVSWSDLDFDFTSAVFDYGDFSHAVFAGKVSFRGAKFTAGNVGFGYTRFTGSTVDFDSARFTGASIDFVSAEYSGGTVSFKSAQFANGTVRFRDAKFTAGRVDFNGAEFTGSSVSFRNTVFSGGTVKFGGTRFIGGDVDFARSDFIGCDVDFTRADFSGGTVDFRNPGTWSVSPRVPFDYGDEPPVGVAPRLWPPNINPYEDPYAGLNA
jgi:hypothetical protein